MSNEAPTDALRLVPNKATPQMIAAMDKNIFGQKMDLGSDFLHGLWENALKAAPASPLPGGVEVLIAELKEAKRLMKPFATYYDINDLDQRAADDAIEVPVGDLRLARAFLARNGKGEG